MGKRDLVAPILDKFTEKPTRILEIGCSSGWRLKALKEKYGGEVWGIDPSQKAIDAAKADGLNVIRASADSLPFGPYSFDLVIFGFSLVFISPEDWPSVVKEADRVLCESGHIVIYDFTSSGYAKNVLQWTVTPENPEDYKPNHLYYYPWKNLWLAYPMYRQTHEIFDMNKCEMAVSLQKGMADLLRGEET